VSEQFLLFLFASAVALVFYVAIHGMFAGAWRLFRRKRRILAAILAVPAIAALYFTTTALARFAPGGDGIVASVKTQSGVELCVVQEFSGEPYAVWFYAKEPNQPWCWHYLDHEQLRWFDASIVVDEMAQTATILDEGGEFEGIYNLRTKTLAITLEDAEGRAGEPMPKDWSPEMPRR
jgi:hypothetical protein